MALLKLRQVKGSGFELTEYIRGVVVQADLNIDQQAGSNQLRIENGAVVLDVAVPLKTLDPLHSGRGGESHSGSQIDIGDAAIPLQLAKNSTIHTIQRAFLLLFCIHQLDHLEKS